MGTQKFIDNCSCVAELLALLSWNILTNTITNKEASAFRRIMNNRGQATINDPTVPLTSFTVAAFFAEFTKYISRPVAVITLSILFKTTKWAG